MAQGQLQAALTHVRRIIEEHGSGPTDAELVRRYAAARDEAAFELLVWRHGAMVLRTCRRLLARPQDAEDAFQATFLAFVRRAGSIGKREAVAGWLYRVACRAAARVLGARARRMSHERPSSQAALNDVPQPGEGGADALLWADVRRVLDDELNRLPAKLRDPIILCYLEGMTNAEAARQLDCPKGTVLSRLARARERLRVRLGRRGVGLTLGTLSAALLHESASAALPPHLLVSTVKAAILVAAGQATAGVVTTQVAALTQGVLNAMFLSKVKIALMVLITLGLAAAGTGGLLYRAQADAPNAGPEQAQPKVQPPAKAPSVDEAKARVDAARANLAVAQLEAEAAEARLQQARAHLALAKQILAKTAKVADAPPVPKEATAPTVDPAQKSPPNEPAQVPALTLGNQTDLINLAVVYVDAVRDLDMARVRAKAGPAGFGVPMTAAMSATDADLKQIAVQAAERKLTLLRAIVEGTLKTAEAELQFAERVYRLGQMSQGQLLAAESKVRILREILASTR